MLTTDEIIEMSPHMICHLISLHSFHDIFINYYIKQTEIKKNQYYMLMYLYYYRENTQSDIAQACLMDRSGVSRAFGELEEKGILTRKYSEDNKRSYKIDLTEKGRDIAKFLKEKELEWEDMICSELGLSREESLKIMKKLAVKSLEFDREKLKTNFKY